MADWEQQRAWMVEHQLRLRGINDLAVLAAMNAVPREEFVPEAARHYAYEDGPLPIGYQQTISQSFIVALMTQAAQLKPLDRVLEIGTGSGYAAAVLAQIVQYVYTIERVGPLAEQARDVFLHLGYRNIEVKTGDGSLGWKEHAPYDVIIATAAAPSVPQALVDQLADGGRLIIPVGDPFTQRLMRVTCVADGENTQELLEYVRFVPLVGEQGWDEI